MIGRLDNAIRAGVIGGILLVVISIMGSVLNWCGVGCIFGLLAILAAAGTGALAARFARRHISGLMEAIVLSGLAGAIAGAIDGALHVVLRFIGPGFYSHSLFGFVSSEISALAWAPLMFVLYTALITVIAVIGGIVYAALTSD